MIGPLTMTGRISRPVPVCRAVTVKVCLLEFRGPRPGCIGDPLLRAGAFHAERSQLIPEPGVRDMQPVLGVAPGMTAPPGFQDARCPFAGFPVEREIKSLGGYRPVS